MYFIMCLSYSCFNVQLNCNCLDDKHGLQLTNLCDPIPFFVSLLQFEDVATILSTVLDFKILLFVHLNCGWSGLDMCSIIGYERLHEFVTSQS